MLHGIIRTWSSTSATFTTRPPRSAISSDDIIPPGLHAACGNPTVIREAPGHRLAGGDRVARGGNSAGIRTQPPILPILLQWACASRFTAPAPARLFSDWAALGRERSSLVQNPPCGNRDSMRTLRLLIHHAVVRQALYWHTSDRWSLSLPSRPPAIVGGGLSRVSLPKETLSENLA